MPATPLHCGIAYLIRKWKPELSLPALIVSTMTADLEIPILYLISGGSYDRLVLHSFVGAATLGTFLSVLITVFAYPSVVSFFLKLDRKKITEKCRFSGTLIALCFIGNLSHVLIDSLHHEFNPFLFPFTADSFDAFVLMNDWVFASIIVTSILFGFLIFFFVDEIRKGIKDFWTRMLVG